ncbi:hypothetical protein [Aliarcobacter butzleri]|uniref:hypothetical protein n=1 Tax=Aliarcobacter butzleri TaxID=28197 RepID=UPI000F46B4FD|nr:hypothetical protein [Aliarcobacter butzleri]
MSIILKKSLFIILLIGLTGCSLKSNDDLIELKPNLNTLTKRANTAIERKGVSANDIVQFLMTNDPILMKNFKNYDLKIKYENQITVVLICKNNKAIYEDLSCDLQIDNDYTEDNKECAFYVQNPICEN